MKNYHLVIRAQGGYQCSRFSSYTSFLVFTWTWFADGGSPSRSNTTQLLVNVKDVNDNAPRFYATLFQESVSENVPADYSIVRVSVSDLMFSISTFKY